MLAIITCSFPVSNWLETFLSSLPFLPFFLPFFFPSFLPSLLSFFHVQPNFQQTRKMDSGNASSLVSKLLPKWQNEFTLAPHWTVFFFQPLCIFCSFLSLLLSSRGTSKPWICFMHTTCNSILLPGFFFFMIIFLGNQISFTIIICLPLNVKWMRINTYLPCFPGKRVWHKVDCTQTFIR